MKTYIIALLAAVVLTGCFHASKNHKSYAVAETYQDGKLASRFEWKDQSRGGGGALFSDPKATQIHSDNTNQNALGGGSKLDVGEITSTARPDAIAATGKAVGEGARAFSGVPSVPIATTEIPGEQIVRIGDNVFRRTPDIYTGPDGKLNRFDGEKMSPIE